MDYKTLDSLKQARDAAYDFTQVCFQKGLCSFEAAKKAQDSIHKDYLRDLKELKKQFMLEQHLLALPN